MVIFQILSFAITIYFGVYVRSVCVKTQSQAQAQASAQAHLHKLPSHHHIKMHVVPLFHMEATSVCDMSDLRNMALKHMFRDPIATLPYLGDVPKCDPGGASNH